MPALHRLLGLAVVLAGCDEPPASSIRSASSASGTAPPTSAPSATLKASVDGQPLALRTATAHSRGGRALAVTFSTASPECADFGGRGRRLADGEQHFTVSMAPVLGDESGAWTITKLYFDSHTQQGRDLGKLTVRSADPKAGVSGELDFELALKSFGSERGPERTLVVKGPFEAKGCGALLRSDGPEARPQDGLSLKMGGAELPIVGATIRPTTFPNPGHELMLSTGPASCAEDADRTDMVLELNVDDAGDVTFAHVRGDLFPVQLNAPRHPDAPTIHVDGPLDAAGEAKLELSGKLDVLGTELGIEGGVTALRCAK